MIDIDDDDLFDLFDLFYCCECYPRKTWLVRGFASS